MTKKRKKSLIIIMFIVSLGCYYLYKEKSCEVQVKCDYMRYACGDCYPQYNISRVISGGCDLNLFDEDISLEFEDPKLENRFEKETPSNVSFPSYNLSGQIHYSIWKRHYILTVNNFTYIEKDSPSSP